MAEQQPERPVRRSARPGGNGSGGMRMGRGLFGWILFIGLLIMVIAMFQMKGRQYNDISLSEFEKPLVTDKVQTVTIDGDDLKGQFRNFETVSGQQVQYFKTSVPSNASSNWAFTQWLLEKAGNAEVKVENNQNILINLLVPLIPWLLIFGVHLVLRLPPASQQRRRGRHARQLRPQPSTRSPPRNTPTSPSTTWPAWKRPRKR